MDERDDVKTDLSTEEQDLQARVENSESELARLEEDLYAVDVELAQLAGQTRKFELLGDICRSLEQLDELGGKDLFWSADVDDVDSRLEAARDHIRNHDDAFVDVEKRRDAIMSKIGKQNFALDCLHYELLEAMEREESRRNEWVVERDADEIEPHLSHHGRVPARRHVRHPNQSGPLTTEGLEGQDHDRPQRPTPHHVMASP